MPRLTAAMAIAFAIVSVRASAAPVVSTASANIRLADAPLLGVNLSGCEFSADGALCPSVATVNTYIDKGFHSFRIPFKAAQAADPKILAKIKALTDAATNRGAFVILDRHEFGNSFDAVQAAWWIGFIKNFTDYRHVLIDTMNEPKTGAPYEADATGASYATNVNAGVAAFRKAGFKHVLLVEWRNWAGMQAFDKHEAASAPCKSAACSFDRAGGLKDPTGLTMISGHRYPDSDGSGTHAACVTGKTGTSLLANAEQAAIQRGLKIWIGEFAFGNYLGVSATCKAIGLDVISHILSLPKTYVGISWWGGGAAWADSYLYKIEPHKGTFATAAASPYLLMLTTPK